MSAFHIVSERGKDMKRGSASRALACVGAVIGAGFASGREVVSFFSQYGSDAQWLIPLAALMMTLLCWLCLQQRAGVWNELFDREMLWIRRCAQISVTLVLVVTGGAMLSAAGHVFELCFPWKWAYSIGAAGTLFLSWSVGNGQLKAMSLISAALTAIFVAAIALAMLIEPQGSVRIPSDGNAVRMGMNAAAYAGMNMTLAIGVVCRCSSERSSQNRFTAMCFGILMLGLMLMSNRLYTLHPEWMNGAFPIVSALSSFGRTGFWLSAALVYLAVFTSLAAVGCALRSSIRPAWIGLGLVLIVSCVGFEGIVNRLYAPAGLCCLCLVFGPLIRQKILTRKR